MEDAVAKVPLNMTSPFKSKKMPASPSRQVFQAKKPQKGKQKTQVDTGP